MRGVSSSVEAQTGVGGLMRYWREARGQSQLNLALDSGISQRHISFIESGRSTPSREILLDLAQTLDVPLRDRNALLLAAGYAPLYPEGSWDDGEMQGIASALKRMLRHHEPFPALVMDRYWNTMLGNDALFRVIDSFIDRAAWTGPRNILDLIFDPAGLRPHVANWDEIALGLIQRVYREAVSRHLDQKTQELLARLLAYPDVPERWKSPKALSAPVVSPMIPLSFRKNGHTLRYFSMVTTVGTPQTITAQEVRIECMFPVDDQTEKMHLELFGEGAIRDRCD
jgi:transcriptional regulator with XRE-family HTH domain